MKSIFSSSHGTLFQGDCLELLRTMPIDSIDVVFADPPFNLGKDYGKGIDDKRGSSEYLAWCSEWILECARVLRPGGTFWLYNLPKWNVELGHILNEAGLTFRHWIAIDIKMSLPVPGRLYPSHYSLLYYTKGRPKTFVRPRTPIALCRHCGGDVKDYGGHRNKLNPEGINLTDVWLDICPVRHKSAKRRGANELSEKFLERVLTISSQEGDVIFDPFGGSGTTYAVAEDMHRKWIGIELGEVEPIIARLEGRSFDVPAPDRGDSGKGITRRREAS